MNTMSFKSNKMVGFAVSLALGAAAVTCTVVPFSTANAQTAQGQAVAFEPIDFCQESSAQTRECARIASANKVVVIAWGGSQSMRDIAADSVRRLNEQGYNTTLIYGADLDNSAATMQLSFMIFGQDPFNRSYAVGIDRSADIDPMVTDTSREIFRQAFPQEAAALELDSTP